MITRLLGAQAQVDFPQETLHAVRRLEDRFPCPDWAVTYQEAGVEHGRNVAAPAGTSDELVVSRRYNGVLLPMAWVGLDEIARMEAEDLDWAEALSRDLARSSEEIVEEELEKVRGD